MKDITACIVTYNGITYLDNNISSLENQTYKNLKIVLIDNCSEDGTTEYIKSKYKNKVEVHSLPENTGGSGGFYEALEIGKKNKYILLLDNDIELKEDCVEKLYKFLEEHKDVGIVGAKIKKLNDKNAMQECGAFIDFKKFGLMPNITDINYDIECDYVASCCMLVRSNCVNNIFFPKNNFIYYDDIEFCWQIKMAGYKVVGVHDAVCYHRKGDKATQNLTTFSRYYWKRNGLNFFSRAINDNEIDYFVDNILQNILDQLLFSCVKEKKEILGSTLYAFDDFLHEIKGKAKKNRIKKIENKNIEQNFSKVLELNQKSIIFLNFDKKNWEEKSIEQLYYTVCLMLGELSKYCEKKPRVYLSLSGFKLDKLNIIETLKNLSKVSQIKIDIDYIIADENNKIDFLKNCLYFECIEHIRKIKKNILPKIYVDSYLNVVSTSGEYNLVISWNVIKPYLVRILFPFIKEAILEIRKDKIMNSEPNKSLFDKYIAIKEKQSALF